MPAKILSLGKDPAILRARNVALERAGYSVISVTGVDDALRLIAQHKFDLAIVGYTFSRREKRDLVARINAAGVPVLLLYLEHCDHGIPASIHVNVFDGTANLLSSIAAMLSQPVSQLEIVDYHFVAGDSRGGPIHLDKPYQELIVSVKGHPSEKIRSYSLYVCTPSGVERILCEGNRPYAFVRNLLIVETYDINVILQALRQQIEDLALYAREIDSLQH